MVPNIQSSLEGNSMILQPMDLSNTTSQCEGVIGNRHGGCRSRNKNCVRFAQSAHEISYNPNRTQEERRNSWYTNDEYTLFEQDCKKSVEIVRTKGYDAAASDCRPLRGLERCISYDFFTRAKHRQKTAIKRVLDEQQYQRRYGYNDPNAIRNVSMVCCEWEKDQALKLAAADAYEVSSSCTNTCSTTSDKYRKRKHTEDQCHHQVAENLMSLSVDSSSSSNKENTTSAQHHHHKTSYNNKKILLQPFGNSSPTNVTSDFSTDWLQIQGDNLKKDCHHNIHQPTLVLLSLQSS